MSKIEAFEDIIAWQNSRRLIKKIYEVTCKGSFSKDFTLRDQMRRAAISILSNIAEGFERNGNKEFIHFLSVAKGSAGELRAQLYIASDLDYVSKEEFQELNKLVVETSKLISGFINYLTVTGLKGAKFKKN